MRHNHHDRRRLIKELKANLDKKYALADSFIDSVNAITGAQIHIDHVELEDEAVIVSLHCSGIEPDLMDSFGLRGLGQSKNGAYICDEWRCPNPEHPTEHNLEIHLHESDEDAEECREH